MTRLPQVLRNVAFDDPEALNSDTVFWSRVRDVDDELGADGRVLVRLSGTEPLVRVMVESRDLAERRIGGRPPRRADRARGAREVRSRPLDLLTMCGIVGVVRRRARRTPPDPTALAADLVEALAVLNSNAPLGDRLGDTATLVSAVDSALRGAPGVRALLGAPNVSAALDDRLGALWLQLDAIERDLDLGAAAAMGAAEIELVNSSLIRARDAVWAVRRDRLARRRSDRRVQAGIRRGDRRLRLDLRRALVARPPRGPRPRLRRAARVRARAQPRSRRRRHPRAARRPHRRSAVHLGVGTGVAELPVVRVQGRRRDR